MAHSDDTLLPLGRLWHDDGTVPDPGQEAARADCEARVFWGLTDPGRINIAVAGYMQRMTAARAAHQHLRPGAASE